jgi:hypothetical protein
MPITRTAMIDDDGSGTTGTVLNNAWKQELYDQIDAITGSIVNAPAGGTTLNDLVVGNSGHEVVRLSQFTQLTGVKQAAGNKVGNFLTVYNIGSQAISVWHEYAGSTPANRFTNFIPEASNLQMAARGSATYIYDSTLRWVMIDFKQGGWISVPYNAANFVPNSGTWVVESGDVQDQRYVVDAEHRIIDLSVSVLTSTITGAPSSLSVGGFPLGLAQSVNLPGVSSLAVGGWGLVMVNGNPSGQIAFTRTDFASFPAATNTAYFYFGGRFRIP